MPRPHYRWPPPSAPLDNNLLEDQDLAGRDPSPLNRLTNIRTAWLPAGELDVGLCEEPHGVGLALQGEQLDGAYQHSLDIFGRLVSARETLKMKTLQFRSPESNQFDFDNWAEAPGLIASLVAPHEPANVHAAIKAHLAAQGIEMLASEPAESPGTTKFSGQMWSPISVPGFDDLQEVQVAIPVKGKVTRGRKGKVRSVAPKQPSAEQVAEATAFVRSLATHGRIAGQGKKAPMGPTHEIETDEKGNRRLVRKRFTAF